MPLDGVAFSLLDGVAFSIELLEWGRIFSGFGEGGRENILASRDFGY